MVMFEGEQEKAAAISDRLQTALGDGLTGSIVTRWVAMVEVIDENGERAVWCLSPPDTSAWDSLGLLQFGIQKEQAGITRDALGGDD